MDYYKILGVEKNATQEEIKKAFRKRAHQYHPDKGSGDEAKFKELNMAYQVLGNEQKRKQYDQFGSSFENMGGAASGGFGGFNGFSDFSGFGGGGININMEDILGNFFRGGQANARQKRRVRGSDIETRMQIDFKEAIFGSEKEIVLSKQVACPRCFGNGSEPGSKISTCQTCKGTGQVAKALGGVFQFAVTCPDCGGDGKRVEKKCGKCHGLGAVKEKKKIKFKVPAGIDNGETIRLSGEGEAGVRGGASGDLYIHFEVKPDPLFKREGSNITSTAFINMSQAALGDKIEVQTIDGRVSLKIPAGTQNNKIFVLKGKGATSLRRAGRGDHFVEVRVKTPENLNKKQKELLEEFARVEKEGRQKSGFWGS